MKRIMLPFAVRKPLLACGADMKGSFAFAKDRTAYLFDGFGDLSDPDNFERYKRAVKGGSRTLGIRPKLIAHDLHPGYFSSQFADSLRSSVVGRQLIGLQHHEAHIAAAMADNRMKDSVIGVAFDGTGYGPDGNVWGGEFFVGGLKGFRRAAHLRYIPMPGAEAAIREPWRMALSYLYCAFGNDFLKKFSRMFKNARVVKEMIDKDINSPLTSSAGRLFDAVSSLVLNKKIAAFEAELPIELERIADKSCGVAYDFKIKKDGVTEIIDFSKSVRAIAGDIKKGTERPTISAKFHNTVAEAILKVSIILRKRYAARQVALSGGVFQNRFLAGKTSGLLEKKGFRVFTHRSIPTNDSGIPIGQIALANARVKCA